MKSFLRNSIPNSTAPQIPPNKPRNTADNPTELEELRTVVNDLVSFLDGTLYDVIGGNSTAISLLEARVAPLEERVAPLEERVTLLEERVTLLESEPEPEPEPEA